MLDRTDKIKTLTASLLEQQGLQRVWENKDVQEFLIPKLVQENKWLDPQSFDDNALFLRAYNVMWAKAQVATELITLLAGSAELSKAILQRINKEKSKNVKPSKSRQNRP
ncbi:hypothetical protein KAR91_80655 [Candidatus Pacearchaeota archaeon]|nr:hypothetical protein [Candidatus Pacearchaeota archaeon]